MKNGLIVKIKDNGGKLKLNCFLLLYFIKKSMKGECNIEKSKYNIQEIKENDIDYPYLLSEIKDRPKKLYVIGNKEILKRKSIAIVGCRECSNYGKEISEKIAYNLAKKNIIVVSGLARGVDTYAHIGTLKAKGKTIAVVAHGLDMIYPKENYNLAKSILYHGGTIVSEQPVGVKPIPENFPKRNRIISGLSVSTIVVEAKEKSGSLITANFALEQGRNLYAVPGSIFWENSIGTNKLIQSGAEVITNYLDLDNFNSSKIL